VKVITHLPDLHVEGRIILIGIFRGGNYGHELYKFWFRTGTSGLLFERGYGISDTVKAKNFTAS